MRTVALIGTSHRYQFPEDIDTAAFRRFIERACTASNVQAIAEELNVEALSQKNVAHSVCKTVAHAAGLAHRYCDPDNAQRKALHIQGVQKIRAEAWLLSRDQAAVDRDIRASHEIRERFWLTELLTLNTWPVLFVCGADHVEPFRLDLQTNGIDVNTVALDWAPGSPS